MSRHKLTETKIRALKPGIHSDGDGLYLRVRRHVSMTDEETLTRQWVFIFKRDGKRTEIALGGHGRGTAPVSLAVAREKAEAIRQRLALGEELNVRKTFADVMEDVIAVKSASFRNEKHKQQWRMTLDTYAVPLHKKAIGSITRDDVVETLKPIWQTIPETADRTRMRIAAVIDHAKARGLYYGDNPADWRGGLKELLPAKQKLSRGHHAAIGYKDLPAALTALRTAKGVSSYAVEFTALTVARSGEVRNAVWAEIDFKQSIWTVPADRMKAGVEHRVPLGKRAIEILKRQREASTSAFIFEGGVAGRPISDTAMTKAMRLASGDDSTLHGLRSSFRDWAGDMTHHARDVVEMALAHTIKDKTEAAYRRMDALEKRRVLLNDWESYCNSGK